MRRGAIAAALLLLGSCGNQEPADIVVERIWARETVPGQTNAAAYFTIVNRGGGADRLVSVASPSAAAATLHSSNVVDGVARMRPITDGLALPAGGSAQFKPGGNHVMLTGLREPLRAGTTAVLRLRFERSGEREVELEVVDAATGPARGGHSGR